MGAFFDALLAVAKATAETVAEVVDSVHNHDKKVGLFILNKDQISDIYQVLTPSEMSGKQWQNISAKLEYSVSFDTVIGFVDSTIFHNGKNGYLFTDDAVYYQGILSEPEMIRYKDIKSMKVIGKNKANDSDRSLVFILKDGDQNVWNDSYAVNKTVVCNLINALIALDNPEQAE